MPDAWDLLPEKERKADTITTFIIFCEGDVTEPTYFESFQIAGKLKVNTIPDQKQGSRHLDNAVAHCQKLDLIEFSENAYKIKQGVTQHLWCVYDRDLENSDLAQVTAAADNNFTNSIAAALRTGLKVAWSNDVFELWVLLHFEDIPTGQRLHREYIYGRLTNIFKDLENQSDELKVITSNPQFNYKQTMKRRNNFIQYVQPLLLSRRAAAMQRAIVLQQTFTEQTPFHSRNPCTMVHALVESLLQFS